MRQAFEYAVPLCPESPWPKFRRDARQTGSTPIVPGPVHGEPWSFRTRMGVFSSPIIGPDGGVYIGSADRCFYAIEPDGTERWRFETNGVIDAAALLDDRGRVFVGSADGRLYALAAADGAVIWTLTADDPRRNGAFIDWFEGNVAIGRDGTLYVPNDNFFVYAVQRDEGEVTWRFRVRDQTWSLPAVDPQTGDLFVGNNNLLAALGANLFSIKPNGELRWSRASNGSIVASPMLTRGGLVVVGGFDGYLRAFDAETGEPRWAFGARDHIYASPGEQPDGTIVQPGTDGTVYGLDPDRGRPRWSYEAGVPVRSSPAIDGHGNVYFGTADGRLVVLEPDGRPRWSIQLVRDGRNDLNASPAIGPEQVVIGSESGEIFGVPLDWGLSDAGRGDGRTRVALERPDDELALHFTSCHGSPRRETEFEVAPNQSLAFSLVHRAGGQTRLAHIDADSLQVEVAPEADVRVTVSGDRKFLTVIPRHPFGPAGQRVRLRLRGAALVDAARDGLAFRGGVATGRFDDSFELRLSDGGCARLPLAVPTQPGDPVGVWELRRMVVSLPTIMPSYNQIGFDALRLLIGLVEGDAPGGRAVAWVVGAKIDPETGLTVCDPETRVLFTFEVEVSGGTLTLANRAGMSLQILNVDIGFEHFRVDGRMNDAGGIEGDGILTASTPCDSIAFYGPFLRTLGFCNPQTDMLNVFGAVLLEPHSTHHRGPEGVGAVRFIADQTSVRAELRGSSLRADTHLLGICLVDADTGLPVSLAYGPKTERHVDERGFVDAVRVPVPQSELPPRLRVYLMVDTYPAVRGELSLQ